MAASGHSKPSVMTVDATSPVIAVEGHVWEPGICPDSSQFNICEHTFLLNKFSGQIVKICQLDTILVVIWAVHLLCELKIG